MYPAEGKRVHSGRIEISMPHWQAGLVEDVSIGSYVRIPETPDHAFWFITEESGFKTFPQIFHCCRE